MATGAAADARRATAVDAQVRSCRANFPRFNGAAAQTTQYNLDELSQKLGERAAQWVPQLFPHGKIKDGKLYLANINGDPTEETGIVRHRPGR